MLTESQHEQVKAILEDLVLHYKKRAIWLSYFAFVLGYLIGAAVCWWAIQSDLKKGSINMMTYKAEKCEIIK